MIEEDEICMNAKDKVECQARLRQFKLNCNRITNTNPITTKEGIECAEKVRFHVQEGKPRTTIINPYDFEDYDDEERAKKILFDGATTKIREEEVDEFINENFEPRLRQKISEHGLTTKEEFIENFEGMYGSPEPDTPLQNYTQETDYIQIPLEEVHETILKHNYKRNKETFEDYPEFKDLAELDEEARNVENLERKDKIILFDKAIHAQHVTGEIMDWSVSDLKDEVDKEVSERQELQKELS